jgi:hypothetical protein
MNTRSDMTYAPAASAPPGGNFDWLRPLLGKLEAAAAPATRHTFELYGSTPWSRLPARSDPGCACGAATVAPVEAPEHARPDPGVAEPASYRVQVSRGSSGLGPPRGKAWIPPTPFVNVADGGHRPGAR